MDEIKGSDAVQIFVDDTGRRNRRVRLLSFAVSGVLSVWVVCAAVALGVDVNPGSSAALGGARGSSSYSARGVLAKIATAPYDVAKQMVGSTLVPSSPVAETSAVVQPPEPAPRPLAVAPVLPAVSQAAPVVSVSGPVPQPRSLPTSSTVLTSAVLTTESSAPITSTTESVPPAPSESSTP